METAITVAVQKLSLNFKQRIPKMPKAKLVIPTSNWNGLPAGQPILAATMFAKKTCPMNAHNEPNPIIIKKIHNRKTSNILLMVLGVLLKNKCKTAPITVNIMKI